MAERHTVETVGEKSLVALVKEFHAEHGALDTVPPGWVSAVQYSEITCRPFHVTRLFLDRKEHTGQVPVKVFRTIGRDGNTRRVKHYFIKSQSK